MTDISGRVISNTACHKQFFHSHDLTFQFGFFVRYPWFRAAGICQANCCNVVFVGTVVCLAVGWTTETILVRGFSGIIFNAAPTAVFFFFSHIIYHSVILSRDHVFELNVAL
jgi:hypothetical protein